MRIAVIMDPLTGIDPAADTTYGFCLEAGRRGYRVFVAGVEDLSLVNSQAYALLSEVEFFEEQPCWKIVSAPVREPLDSFDYVLMRKDPPFNERYVFATHLLGFCRPGLVLNRPDSLLLHPEKLYAHRFPGIFPETLITHSFGELEKFLRRQGGKAILKPINGNGGAGVFLIREGDPNLRTIWETLSGNGEKMLVVQRFIAEVERGDMRVVFVNGKVEGVLLRTPQKGEIRANIHVGGTTSLVESLSPGQQRLCERIGDRLRKDGFYFVGADLIGESITEINVTSPTGIREILRLGGKDIAKIFWDGLESRRSAKP